MTSPEAAAELGVSTVLLSGAAELAVSTGALEATPLAEVLVDGAVEESVGEGEPVSVGGGELCDSDGVGDAECEVVGVGEVGLLVDFVGDGLVCPPPELLVPLGLSEGRPLLPGGVGSSDVPYVPSGPGSVGLLVAVPVSSPSPFFAGSAPRLSPSPPWLADGLTPTLSDGLSALLLDVAPRVTTVPRTAASRTPAPAATRLRRA